MFVVKYFSHWNGYFNVFESESFDTLEEAKTFASKQYMPTIYKRVPSPSYMNSKWMLEEVK